MAPVCRQPEGAVALLVPDVDLRAAAEQELDEAVVSLVRGDRQRRVARRRNRRRVHVGVLVKQDPAHVDETAGRSLCHTIAQLFFCPPDIEHIVLILRHRCARGGEAEE